MSTARSGGGAARGSDGDPYAGPGAYGFERAVDALGDPLTDPLPSKDPAAAGTLPPQPATYDAYGAYDTTYDAYGTYEATQQPQNPAPPYEPYDTPETYDPPEPYQGSRLFDSPALGDPATVGLQRPSDPSDQPAAPDPAITGGRAARRRAAAKNGTAVAGTVGGEAPSDAPTTGGRAARRRAARGAPANAEPTPSRVSDQPPTALPPVTGGRAARRRAAKSSATKTESPSEAPTTPTPGGRAARRKAAAVGAAGSRAEPMPEPPVEGGRAARRRAAKAAAKAARQTGTAVSNVIGELFITTGVLLMLFVVYQLWWTNVQAKAHADGQANSLQDQWQQGESQPAGDFSPGEGFAILYLPTLDVRVPIAQTVDAKSVLDQGMVGHYTKEDELPTAMPWDKKGNFGLAGHRNTHGEPFRYINKLQPGDPIVVETEKTFYTYQMTRRLDSTSPSNISVLDPIPEQSGFTKPGRYITLTTCTPEFTSTYRLIVWGEMAEERPRSEGMPDALVS